MISLAIRWRNNRRGVAALEFALVCPLLLTFFGGVVDLGLAVWSKSCLANAVAQGAQYAYRLQQTGTNVTQTQIQNFVLHVSTLPSSNINVSGTTVPGYYCLNAVTPPPTLAASSSGATCGDGTKAGLFVKVSATYTYPALMPGYSYMANTTITESTWVRLS
jgi:Flp pilus assembly protein TadG